MVFAEVSDIEARWRELTEAEQARAEVLIEDASAMLSDRVTVDAEDAEQAALLKMVCCNAVIRVLASDTAAAGVDTMSMTAGPYSQSWNYNSTAGELVIKKREWEMLGVSSAFIGSIRAKIGDDAQ